jgi:hypothetical protein
MVGEDLVADLRRDLPEKHFTAVFDVGAHAGQITRHYARAFPSATIHSFEPVRAIHLYRIYGQTKEWSGGGYPVLRRFDPVFINGRLIGPLQNLLDR